MRCRFCHTTLKNVFVTLGSSPLSNIFLSKEQLNQMEPFYPLTAYVCDKCFLVQLEEYESPESIFGEYAYFSSYSDSWLQHCREYVDKMIISNEINNKKLVVEIASNDGYLLQYFVTKGIPVLGIEPAANVAKSARKRGIPTKELFFGAETARELVAEGKSADLIIGNNVLAHVPNINDFLTGMKILLSPSGLITMEFPHLMRLVDEIQFDTIYHEHFSYFSLLAVDRIIAAHGLVVYDVEELTTHGGSLRIYVKHVEDDTRIISGRVNALKEREINAGYTSMDFYNAFGEMVKRIKRDILKLLIQLKEEGKTIVGYGAPAKGNTLLNYCGIKTDFIDYTVDRNPYKQGRYLPGSRIPVEAPEKIWETKPDYVFIFPWNLKNEIMEQTQYIRQWGGKYIIPIPNVKVI